MGTTLLAFVVLDARRTHRALIAVFQATPELDNGNGQVMGGFLAAMMDVCVAQAVVVQSTLTQTVSTLEQKTSLLAPVRLSRKPDAAPVLLRCKATAIKRGKTVAFYEVSLSDEKGVLVAKATQTTLVINIPKHSPKPQAKL